MPALLSQAQIEVSQAKWTNPNQSDNSWTAYEQTLCKEVHMSDLPFISHFTAHNPCFKNATIATTLTAWWKYHQITDTTISPTKHTPIWNNPDFSMNRKPLNFSS